MKAYLLTTCVVFGVITVAHIWRGIVEGVQLMQQPWYILMTLVGAALCFWGVLLLRRGPRV
jgi:hypothetical protein